MTAVDLDRLEQLARAAQHVGGETWVVHEPLDGNPKVFTATGALTHHNKDRRFSEPVVRHVAAFDPTTALALIAELRAARSATLTCDCGRAKYSQCPVCDNDD